jgi:hypothetical protein
VAALLRYFLGPGSSSTATLKPPRSSVGPVRGTRQGGRSMRYTMGESERLRGLHEAHVWEVHAAVGKGRMDLIWRLGGRVHGRDASAHARWSRLGANGLIASSAHDAAQLRPCLLIALDADASRSMSHAPRTWGGTAGPSPALAQWTVDLDRSVAQRTPWQLGPTLAGTPSVPGSAGGDEQQVELRAGRGRGPTTAPLPSPCGRCVFRAAGSLSKRAAVSTAG